LYGIGAYTRYALRFENERGIKECIKMMDFIRHMMVLVDMLAVRTLDIDRMSDSFA